MELLLVYNADTGMFATLSDFAHKFLSPQTYPCHLCALTYGKLTIKKKWRDFIASLPYPTRFLHRDEFNKRYPDRAGTVLPVIFIGTEGGLSPLVSALEINAQRTVEELMDMIVKRLHAL